MRALEPRNVRVRSVSELDDTLRLDDLARAVVDGMLNGMPQRWELLSVRHRLADMAAKDPDLRRFGASTHKYQLNPPLAQAKVEAFERRWNITLPESYRSFIIDVGNGGAGPYYGLYRVGDTDPLLDPDGPLLAMPFPHVTAWNADSLPPQDEDAYFSDEQIAGSLALAHFGCGDFLRLVITGEARGEVWQDGRGGDYGIWPVAADFADWYAEWLLS